MLEYFSKNYVKLLILIDCVLEMWLIKCELISSFCVLFSLETPNRQEEDSI